LNLQGVFDSRKVNMAGTKVPLTLNGSKEASMKVYEELGFTHANWDAIVHSRDTANKGIPFMEIGIKEGVVPNVVGMGLVDALYTMENAGFKANVVGRGRVIAQSLHPGDKLKMGTQVSVQLN